MHEIESITGWIKKKENRELKNQRNMLLRKNSKELLNIKEKEELLSIYQLLEYNKGIKYKFMKWYIWEDNGCSCCYGEKCCYKGYITKDTLYYVIYSKRGKMTFKIKLENDKEIKELTNEMNNNDASRLKNLIIEMQK